ncbi:hypothetical protein [Thalassobacillus devorans]|uniref:hypothetical protein n=1 Tax=Thalassobacillus devorans TaxID=279813 RepID=UPI00190F7379|nr:hypothetical protein [Thalassobacillus devorans]
MRKVKLEDINKRIEANKKSHATIKLLSKMIEAENSIKTGDEWLPEDEVKKGLGL